MSLLPSSIERPAERPPSLREVLADVGGTYAANALVAFIFCATGPVAILLAVGDRGRVAPSDLASWIFGAFFVNGLVTIVASWLYRQPLVILWTIPGAVLLGPAFAHFRFAEMVGAFLVTGLIVLALGLSGWVRRAAERVPMPIVMGMVAGIFLRFGTDLVFAIRDDLVLALPMTMAFLAATAIPSLARRLPPLVAALVAGGLVVAVLGRFHPAEALVFELARPNVYVPELSLAALVALVPPLVITVLAIQNGQGIAVLTASGHPPPIDAVTATCGAATLVTGLFGAVPTCLTGPVNAMMCSSGVPRRQYTGAILLGLFAMAFGLASPIVTRILLATPKTFLAALAGLAMLRVLQSAFAVAFRDRFTMGALVAFLVTVADVPIASVGAAFWGLVFGFAVSWVLERKDFEPSKR